MENKIQTFTDLRVWKEGHELVLLIYRLTKNFPKDELFGLISQMRRCAVSITSNIAEGFSRSSSKEKSQFYSTSLGSVTELQNQLFIAKDLILISREEFDEAFNRCVIIHKMLNGLMKSSMTRNT